MTDNTIAHRVLTYTRRKADGQLLFPHAVRAHMADIMLYAPWALTAAEIRQYNRTTGTRYTPVPRNKVAHTNTHTQGK